MSTVATTTQGTPLGQAPQTFIDRHPGTGHLWAAVRNSSGATEFYRSTDNGASWATSGITFSRSNIAEWGPILIDNSGFLHIVYRTNESSQDRVYYRRMALATGAWMAAELLVAAPSNGGSAGAVHTGLDVQAVILPTGTTLVAVAVGTTVGGQIGLTMFGVDVPAAGSPVVNNARIAGARQWLTSGLGRVTPCVDLEHVGDGKSAAVPHLWVGYGRTILQLVKLAWSGSGWTGPANPVTLATGLTAQNAVAARWNGQAHLSAYPDPVSTSTVTVVERNRANTTSTLRSTPTHPTGVVRNCVVSYNAINRDIRVYAVGTSTDVLYFVDYVRASNTWTSWATVTATAILGVTQYSVRRGSSGNARHDVLTVASGSPNVISHTSQPLSYTPNAPMWDLAGAPYVDGGGADVALALSLRWLFSDPDPSDAQSAYALSRQIGGNVTEYWQASTQTWQLTEQKNSSGTSAVTLPAGFAEGFEQGAAGWTPFNGTIAQSSAQARSDVYSGLFTSSGTPAQAYPRYELPVTPGVHYYLSLFVFSVAGYGAVNAAIDWFDASHVYISTSNSASTALGAGAWAARSTDGIAPANAAFAQFGPTLTANPPNGTAVYLDDVDFGSSPSVWAAASDPATVFKVKVWDGADVASLYSVALTVIPSAKVNPTITSPTDAGTVSTQQTTVEWSVSEQAQWRLQVDRPDGYDAFGATVSNGWGTDDLGASWATSGGATSDYSKGSGLGSHLLTSVNVSRKTLIGSSESTSDVTVSVATTAVATGAAITAGVLANYVDTDNYYRGEARFGTDGTITAAIVKRVGAAETTIALLATGIAYTANTLYRVRLQVSSGQLRLKVWRAADPEPYSWINFTVGSDYVSDTDLSAGLKGCYSRLTTGNTNTSPSVRFDRFARSNHVLPAYDSGWSASALTRSDLPPVTLPDGTIWLIWLSTRNAERLASDWATAQITVDYIEPATPTLVATPSTANGWIAVAITNPAPAGGQPQVTGNDLYRRRVGSTDPTLLATGLANGGSYEDWQVPAGVAMEYQVITHGVNGTFAASAWTA